MLNPVDGRINNYEPLYKQVGIPPDTLSRFDLVFVIPDIREEAKDSNVGYAMLNARGIPHSGINGNSPIPKRTLMPLEDMQKLIAYAKTINPVLSREGGDEIHRIHKRYALDPQDDPRGHKVLPERRKPGIDRRYRISCRAV